MNDQDLQQLVRAPQESLDVELKSWIDPDTPEGKAKIAIACLALRNNNGGFLLIGFHNDGSPAPNPPPSVESLFHIDKLQTIVTNYAHEGFAISVSFVARDEQLYPVIVVPSGVETPVAARRELANPAVGQKPLVSDHAVYVRTVNKGAVSSTIARKEDWGRIVKLCFDNREADVGQFVRRHLSGLLTAESLRIMLTSKELADIASPSTSRLKELSARGFDRFVKQRGQVSRRIESLGFREAASVVDSPTSVHLPTEDWLHAIHLRRPRHSGWAPFMGIAARREEPPSIYTTGDAWEAFFGTDLWRIGANGDTYQVRELEDDSNFAPHTVFDFVLQIQWVAEVIAAIQVAMVTLGCVGDARILITFRWIGLSGRTLASWYRPDGRLTHTARKAVDDEYATSIDLAVDTPKNALGAIVTRVVKPLFALFEGQVFHDSVIEDIVQKFFARQH